MSYKTKASATAAIKRALNKFEKALEKVAQGGLRDSEAAQLMVKVDLAVNKAYCYFNADEADAAFPALTTMRARLQEAASQGREARYSASSEVCKELREQEREARSATDWMRR